MPAIVFNMPTRQEPPSGSSFIVAHAEAEIYEAAVDLELEIRAARTVSECLRLFQTTKDLVALLDRLQVLTLERADQLCGKD